MITTVQFHKNASGLIAGASLFQNTLVILDNALVESYGSVTISREKPGIINKSKSKNLWARTIINSSAKHPVQQDREGTLDLIDTLFVNNERQSDLN